MEWRIKQYPTKIKHRYYNKHLVFIKINMRYETKFLYILFSFIYIYLINIYNIIYILILIYQVNNFM